MTDGSPIGSRAVAVVVLAAIVSIVTLLGLPEGFVAYDFVEVYVPAGERVLDGEPLYPDRDDPVVSDNRAYVYPPATALLAAPLSGLSDLTLEIVGVLGSFAALFGALWLLHVRDIRCYAVVALWLPTVLAWQNANLSVIVTLACALVWRFRDSAPKAGTALGLGIALKVLLWPLVGWLVATKRLSAAALAIVVGAGGVLISWAVIGFDGLASYQGLVSRLTEIETRDPRAISVYAAALEIKAPPEIAYVVTVAVGVSLLAVSFLLGRRGQDREAFTLGIVAVLAFAPIVWLHYLTILLVPLAIYRPRLSAAWALPIAFWAVVFPGTPSELTKLVASAVVALLVASLLAPKRLTIVRERLTRRRRSSGLRERAT